MIKIQHDHYKMPLKCTMTSLLTVWTDWKSWVPHIRAGNVLLNKFFILCDHVIFDTGIKLCYWSFYIVQVYVYGALYNNDIVMRAVVQSIKKTSLSLSSSMNNIFLLLRTIHTWLNGEFFIFCKSFLFSCLV